MSYQDAIAAVLADPLPPCAASAPPDRQVRVFFDTGSGFWAISVDGTEIANAMEKTEAFHNGRTVARDWLSEFYPTTFVLCRRDGAVQRERRYWVGEER